METMVMEQIGDRNEKGPGTDYRILVNRVRVLMEKQRFYVTNLANASAAIWEALPRINWAGFYLRLGDELWLGPFQGKPARPKSHTGAAAGFTFPFRDNTAAGLAPEKSV